MDQCFRAWVSANVEGSYKRSAVLGMAIGWGNLNGAVTSNVVRYDRLFFLGDHSCLICSQYRSVDTPWYRLGHGIVLAYIAIGWLSTLALYVLLKRENACRERGERDEMVDNIDNKNANPSNGIFESVEVARTEKGDLWSGFRYTL